MVRRYDQTLYELVAEHPDGRRVLICYSQGKGRRWLWRAVTNKDCLSQLFGLVGTHLINFAARAADGAIMGEWKIRFSGRTQRDCQGRELPWLGDAKEVIDC